MENVELYMVNNSVQRKDAEVLMAEFAHRLSWGEAERVLDVGCGPGDVTTQVILPHLPKDVTLVGADLSSNMVEFANEEYSNENISFKTLDFGTKEMKKYFPEQHFSKIFSVHCLHWIGDQKQACKNVFSLLRPGGEFVAVFTPCSQLFLALKLLSEFDEYKQYCQDVDSIIPPLFYSQNPCEEYKQVLTSQGMEVLVCEQRQVPVTYPNTEYMKRSFEAFNPFVKRMPEEVKEQYLEFFEMLVKERIPVAESGEVHLENPVLIVHARRPVVTWSHAKPSHTSHSMH